jgi:hypothetical protein
VSGLNRFEQNPAGFRMPPEMIGSSRRRAVIGRNVQMIGISIRTVLGAMLLAAGFTTAVVAADAPKIKEAPSPKRIMLIGNSFYYYNNSLHNHLRKIVRSVFTENPKDYYLKSMTISGSYLSDHALGSDGMIKSRKWDVVILQGQSREPINPKKSAKFEKAARALDGMIRAAGAKTVFFMTWAYKHKPEMSEPLAEAYTRIGNELDALVAPVGLAFARDRAEAPATELYQPDRKHPSLLGTYLAACVLYATLYRKTPVGVAYTAGLSDADAAMAQRVAWETTQAYFK